MVVATVRAARPSGQSGEAEPERFAQLAAKARTTKLSPKEKAEKAQVEMFVETREEVLAPTAAEAPA